MLYFAYGSNLDENNWALWCKSKGYDAASRIGETKALSGAPQLDITSGTA